MCPSDSVVETETNEVYVSQLSKDDIKWRLSSHQPLKRTLLETLTLAFTCIKCGDWDCQCGAEIIGESLQFYMGSRCNFNRRKFTENDINDSCVYLTNFGPKNVFTHLPLTYNLAGLKDCLGWCSEAGSGEAGEGNDPLCGERIDKKSISKSGERSDKKGKKVKTPKEVDYNLRLIAKSIEYECSVLSKIGVENGCEGARGCVVHPGCYPDSKKGMDAIIKTINLINFPSTDEEQKGEVGCYLLLETAAGEGSKLCNSIDELFYVWNGLSENNKKSVGLCIDTCHVFASGQYDLRKISEVDRMFLDVENKKEWGGIDIIKLIHLNDSKAKFGTRKDRHAYPCQGEIWKDNQETFKYLIEKIEKYNIPTILE